jgi:hypothetical protein
MAEAQGLQDGEEVEGDGRRLLRLRLARWLVFLAPGRGMVALFAELVRRLAVATVSAVGKEFTLGSRRRKHRHPCRTSRPRGRHLLALFAAELVVALMALDAFWIRCLCDTADHHDVEGADALSLGVVGHGVPTGCAGALSMDHLAVAAADLDGVDNNDREDEE